MGLYGYGVIDAGLAISMNTAWRGLETRGGIDSKITLRSNYFAGQWDWVKFTDQDIGICSVSLYPASPSRRRPSPLPSSVPPKRMLVGPCPPTHASSYLLRDAMERRGRSRVVSSTAALRKSHYHQRQLYYSHCPTNPPSPSPSPSPVRSTKYVPTNPPHSP